MKKKGIAILSGLLIIFFVILVIDSFSDGIEGWNSAMYDSKHSSKNDTYPVSITLKPTEMYNSPDTLTTTDGKQVPFQIQDILVKAESSPENSIIVIVISLIAFPILLFGGVYSSIAFIKFIRDIQRQNIFIKPNVKRLYAISAMLTFIGILQNLIPGIDHYLLLKNTSISMPGYIIDNFEFKYELFFVAILFALFAQIFAMGVKMKEEQDLTV